MRRRFGRRRRRPEGGRSAPIEAHWLERISASETIAVTSLERLRYDDVADSFALTAVGRGAEGEKCLVGFAPKSGGDALLGALVAARSRSLRSGTSPAGVGSVRSAPRRFPSRR
jgi:hypothetical protein